MRLRILLIASFYSLFSLGQTDNRLGLELKNGPLLRMSGSSLPLKFAFSGGLDLPQWSRVDLDQDGQLDLVAFDRNGHRWTTFLAQGNQWVAAPSYADSLPKVREWALFRDYNNDGQVDLFHASIGGMGVYENTSQPGSLEFQWALGNASYLRTNVGTFLSNLYNINSDIPGIVDIDGDGDLDIFTFGQRASIEWHEGLSANGLNFQLNTACWGRFQEDAFTNNLFLNSCTVQKTEGNSGALHAGSSILPINLNGDSLFDVLIGDVSYSNVVVAYNAGRVDSAYMNATASNYPVNEPIDLEYFPALYYEDVNFDSVPDLLLSPNLLGSINTQNAWLKVNNGTTNLPSFSNIDSNFITDELLDLGTAAHPALVDIDFDGDFDMVVSSAGVRTAGGNYQASLHYFKNVGNSNNPVFELADADFADAGQYNLSSELSPSLGDLDGDFDADMIVGTADGKVYYYENTGTLFSPSMTYRGQLQNIDVGNSAAPAIGDLNNDGANDLLIGNEQGYVAYYENTGSFPNIFTLVDAQWAGISTQSNTAPNGYSTPAFVYAQDTSLLVGSTDQGLLHLDSVSGLINGAGQVSASITGSTSSASTSRESTPFGGSKRNGRVQFTILASELNASGATFGKIEEFSIEMGATNGLYLTQGFTIRMAAVDGTTSGHQSGFYPESAYTTVYEGIRVLSQGWNTIPLYTPFQWNGSDHISIEICFTKHAQTGDLPAMLHTTNTALFHYGDVSAWNGITQPGCEMPYGDSLNTRPNIKLAITPTLIKTATYAQSAGDRIHPACADLNGDGHPDLIVGTLSGGLLYFEGKTFAPSSVAVGEWDTEKDPNFVLYPNPTSGSVVVESSKNIERIRLFDLQGVLLEQFDRTSAFTAHVPAGMYLLVVHFDDGSLRTERVVFQ